MPAISPAGAPAQPPLPVGAVDDAIRVLWGLAPGGPGAAGARAARRRTFAGRPDQVARARGFVRRALAGSPAEADAELLASELATNAVRHTRSGAGGAFEVVVWRGPAAACVAVADDGPPAGSNPAPGRGASAGASGAGGIRAGAGVDPGPAESGHGLAIVAALATRWGCCPRPSGRPGQVVWFLLSWEPERGRPADRSSRGGGCPGG